MNKNLIAKNIDKYFENMIKKNKPHNNNFYTDYVEPNILLLFFIFIIIVIIFIYCKCNVIDDENNIELKKEDKEFIKKTDKNKLMNIINELNIVNEKQKSMQNKLNQKMNYLNKLELNNKNNLDSAHHTFSNFQNINNNKYKKIDDVLVEVPYV